MNRREILQAAALSAGPLPVPAGASGATGTEAALARYHSFGVKASGGAGDQACGAWMQAELERLGLACTRQTFSIAFFEVETAQLACGAAAAPLIPQAPVLRTRAEGVEGPLALADAGAPLAGALALVVLPHRRWSALRDPAVERPVRAAMAAGAAGVIVVTTGPTGEALALNAPAEAPAPPCPVAVLAPKDAAPFLAAARTGARARLTLTGRGGRREAWNLIGRRDRGGARALVVSTPRSGWFGCAGERGPGVATWLRLAAWTRTAAAGLDHVFIATSGHEYDNFGGEQALRAEAPPPERTALWAHLGAGLAARDWHEVAGRLLPLPSPDPQRLMVASDAILPVVRRAFAGEAGLEAAYPASAGAEGELKAILAAGHARVFGGFGGHRFHHAASDDLRCVSAPLVDRLGRAYAAAITGVLSTGAS